ncbi:HD domain-containing protein, partial [Coleofasciculus sp. FACHB-T130]|uniref:HD domain-containing protein n=1 Tax=Cyanophyceae TaxID=3028117 RepID=UPI0016834078
MQASSRESRQHADNKAGDQRTPFQIDRDRLLYSTYFRRLSQVTQVASASEGSIFHNRLTHSLKVAQIARRLAEKLIQDTSSNPGLRDKCGGLDPDVVESAALAHDLGHPPFGHVAEKELDKLSKD